MPRPRTPEPADPPAQRPHARRRRRRATSSPGALLVAGRAHRRGLARHRPRRRRGHRPRRRHPPARADGHGGQPVPRRARPPQPADPPCRRTRRCGPCAASPTARRTLRAGFTTVRNLGLFVQTGGILLDVALKKAIDLGWVDGPRVVPAGHAICPDRRPPRPHHVPGLRPARAAPHRRGGHRQRRRRGPQGRPLPDQVRRPGHQGVRVRRRDVPHRSGRRPAVLRRGAARPSPTRPTAPGSRWPPTPTATRASGPPLEAGIDCIEHGSLMTDETLDLFIEQGTFLVATTYLADGMDVSHAAARAPGQGGRGLPPGQGRPSARPSRGVRRSRAAPTPRPSPTAATPRSWSPSSTGA